MKTATLVVRIIFGLLFVIFGLNEFLGYLPRPQDPHPQVPDLAKAFFDGLVGSGYFFPVLKITEIASGLLILSGKLVPLGLILIVPVVVQIFLFHAFLMPAIAPMSMAIFLLAANIFIAYAYRDHFKGILEFHSSPK